MSQRTLRDLMMQIITAVGIIVINVALITFIARYKTVWPWELQLAVIVGLALAMYATSLYSYHTKWGQYAHGPLFFAGIFFMPLGIASVTGTWSAASLNPLVTSIWFNNRDYALLIAVIIQLILSTGAWWYCKSMASLAGFIFSIYELYFWVIEAVTPLIMSVLGLNFEISLTLIAGIIFYVGLIIVSYIIRDKFYALAHLMRWIGITAIGIKTINLFKLFPHNLWWGMMVWLLADAAIITYGMKKQDDSFVIGGVLALFGFAVMALGRYTENIWRVGSIYTQVALVISAFVFLFIMLGRNLVRRYSSDVK